MLSNNRAKPNDLFNFQGIRKRIRIADDYSANDERLNRISDDENQQQTSNEYNELDLIEQQFESYVRPAIDQNRWISDRKSERNEINRLGDILDFYNHKPHLTEVEKRVYKRMTRQDRAVQTDEQFDDILKTKKTRIPVPIINLPPPLGMERIEEFLARNHWRLVDLFRKLDQDKTWTIVKEDFMRIARKDDINLSDSQAEELMDSLCRDVNGKLDYKKLARGRLSYKKTIRENTPKTPSSFDTQLESNSSSTTRTSNYLPLPTGDIPNDYISRRSPTSYAGSTVSSMAKQKRNSISTTRTDSQLSAYQ